MRLFHFPTGEKQEGNLWGSKHHMLLSVVLQPSLIPASQCPIPVSSTAPRVNKAFALMVQVYYLLLNSTFCLSHSLYIKCLSFVSEPKKHFRFHIVYKVFPNTSNTISNDLSLSYLLFTSCYSHMVQKNHST